MKVVKYAWNYLKRNLIKSLVTFLIIFVMAFVMFTSISIRGAQSTLYKNMATAQGITYRLNSNAPFIADSDYEGVRLYYDNYKATIIRVIEIFKELSASSEVIDHDISYLMATNYLDDDGYHSVLISGVEKEDFDKFDPYLCEGTNLNKTNDPASSILVSDQFLIYDPLTAAHRKPKIGETITFYHIGYLSLFMANQLPDYSFIEENANGDKIVVLGEYQLKVAGIYEKPDPYIINNSLYYDEDIIALYYNLIGSADLVEQLLRDANELESAYPSHELIASIIKESGGQTSIYTPPLEERIGCFTILEANLELGSIENAAAFEQTAQNDLAAAVRGSGNGLVMDVYLESTGIEDLNAIIEPFDALRSNLDSSIMAIMVFLLIMIVISNIYVINSRNREMMIRRALGEKTIRQFAQYLFENFIMALIAVSAAFAANIMVVTPLITLMFKQSIETQNNLRRIADGTLAAYDELYEAARYGVVNVGFNDYLLVMGLVIAAVGLSCLLSFVLRRKMDIKAFLNS